MTSRETIGRLSSRGAGALSDTELLELLLDEEAEYASRLMAACGGTLAGVAREELPRLRMAEGLGLRRAARLVAAAEFGRRVAAAQADETSTLASTDEVVRLFRPQLEPLPYEECWAIYLSSSNRILARQRMSQGGVQGTVIDHRMIVKRALELLATQFVLVHNHPSGAAEPSGEDLTLTRRVADAAALFDIHLLDHVIIARGAGIFSFRVNGLL